METFIAVVIFVGLILSFIVAMIISIYNSIIDNYNRVKQSWSDVIVQERQKINILPRIESLLQDHKIFESELQKSITNARSLLSELTDDNNKFDPSKLELVENAYRVAKNSIMATVEAYPELKSHTLYSSVMSEIVEQEENVGAAIRIYNNNTTIFNTKIESFPDILVNKMITHKEKINTFANEAVESTIGFKPDFN